MHMKLGRFQRRRQYHKKQVKIALSGQTKKNYQRRSRLGSQVTITHDGKPGSDQVDDIVKRLD